MADHEGKFLDELSRFARQQEAEERRRFDERWQRLADGTISEADDAALRALAEASEEAKLDYEALRPLGPQFHDRLARQWQERTPAASPEPVVPFPVDGRGGSRSLPNRLLAVAATLIIAVIGWQFLRGPELPALPEYSHELHGEVQEMRSPEHASDVPIFGPGSPFRLVLRPQEPIEQHLERRFYLESQVGALRELSIGYELSADGSVEITETVGQDAFLLEPGDWTLVFVYGRSGRLPDRDALTAARPSDDWQVIRVPFRVQSSSIKTRLEIELAGCKTFYANRASCIPGKELTLWVRAPGNPELRVGNRWLGDPGTAIDGGRRFTFAASSQDRQVVVALNGEDRWHLELVDRQLPDWLVDARKLFADGEPAAARDLIVDRVADAEPVAKALAKSTLARVLMRLGASKEEVLEHLAEAIDLHEESKDLINLARDLGMATYLYLRHQDFLHADQRLERLTSALEPGAPVEAQLLQLHYQVILGRKLGYFREALESAQRELTLARRLGLAKELAQTKETMALVLQDLGRFAQADELLSGLESAYEGNPCSQVRLLNNRAWVLIRAADPALGDPLPLHSRALEIAEREDCGASRMLDVLLDQARALVEKRETLRESGDRERIADLIARALRRAHDLIEQATPLQLLWQEQIEGLLDLQNGEASLALAHFKALEEQSLRSFFDEGQWLAKLGQAKAYRQGGETQEAIDSLGAAEDLLDEHSLRVPLHSGRARFMAEREDSARFYLQALLDAGRATDALTVARRSRSRLLRGVHLSHRLESLDDEERKAWDKEIGTYALLRTEIEAAAIDDWRLPEGKLKQDLEARAKLREDALGALDRAFQVLGQEQGPTDLPPIGDEVVLIYHPLPQGWVGFGALDGRVESHRFELPEDASAPDGLTRRLLEPFRDLLTEGRKVRILPFGRLKDIDFHALPWNGDVLLAAHPVVYGLDLASQAPTDASQRMLVVSDPRSDLPAAQVEGEAVAAMLQSSTSAWEVQSLVGPEATRVRFSKLVAEVDLLHYAGHSAFAGPFGWQSSLLLAKEGHLTLGDVLALGGVPSEVVLSSCESARTADDGGAPNLGLAQAFVVAGAERVIAAVRPVGDQSTARFFSELYANVASSANLAEALRRAQLSWRKRDPVTDWASFRLLEP